MSKKQYFGRRIKGQGSKWIRREKRLAIYARDNFRCVYCNCSVVAGEQATLDHVKAVELGGNNHESNLVTACLSCNSAKRHLSLSNFLQYVADQGRDPGKIRKRIIRNTRRVLRKGVDAA